MARTRHMLPVAILVVLLASAACTVAEMPIPLPTSAPTKTRSLTVGDDIRRYEVYAPDLAPPGTGWPLVIAVHGLGSNAVQMRTLTGFDDVAADERFIVAYPEGLSRAWLDADIGDRFTDSDIATRNLAFIEALIEELDREYSLDDRRIYMAGLSNGGMFAFHAACYLSDRLAAVSLVAAASVSQSFESCEPEQPVSYIAFHGTSDTVVPYIGGPVVPGFESLGRFQSAHEAAGFWARVNDCAPEPAREELPDTNAGDMSVAYLDTWEPCDSGMQVELVTLHGSGHTWPGHPPAGQRLGATNLDVDATRMTWEFFKANPKLAR